MNTKALWDSNAEAISYEILKELINLDCYNINIHTTLKDIFPAENKEDWLDYHVDFLIIDKKGMPVLGIEINGIEHWNFSDTISHDEIKRRLFCEYSIPLICIPLAELTNYSKTAYADNYKDELRSMITMHLSHLFYDTAYPAYCWKCKHKFAYRYRNDYTGAFYCCTNEECENYIKNKTFSKSMVPPILSEGILSFIANQLGY